MDTSKIVKMCKVAGEDGNYLITLDSSVPPAARQHLLELMDDGDATRVTYNSDGVPIISDANPGDEAGFPARWRKKMMKNCTVERNGVIAEFFAAVQDAQRATTFEDFEVLADDVDDDLEMEFGRHPLPEVDLCEENRVDIQTLYDQIHEQLKGKFLLCRTITGAMNGAWLETVVEDPSGKTAIVLRLKNFTPPKYSLAVTKALGGTGNDWFEWLPSGSYVAVKNTFASSAKVRVLGIKTCAVVCCSNPAEVVLLSSKKMKELFSEMVWQGSVSGFNRDADYRTSIESYLTSRERIGATIEECPVEEVTEDHEPVKNLCKINSNAMAKRELYPASYFEKASFWDGAGRTDVEIMETLKRKGNMAFVTKRYTDALRWYDLALEYTVNANDNSNLVNIWSNKAAAFIGLGCFLRALMFCDQVLVSVPNHVKVIYRKVKALIGLGRMGEVEAFLKDKLVHHPALMENEDLRGLMESKPWKKGVGDFENEDTLEFMKNVNEPCKRGVKDLDFRPDFVGPIECRPSSTSCRGVFATEDISPGRILLSHRCFAHVGDRDDWMPERTLDPIPNKLVGNELVGIIANKVAFSPELGKEIYKLWAGNKLKILDENDDSQNMKVLMTRIQKIVANNAVFECNHYEPSNAAGVSTIGAQLDHICVDANVMILNFGPLFKLQATKVIKKGERLLMTYYAGHQRLEHRKQMLKKVGRTCNCRLCQFEGRRNTRMENKLDKFHSELTSIEARDYDRNRGKVNAALKIVRQVEQLHADAPDLNTMMLCTSIRNTLCDALFKRGLFQEFVTLCEKIFTVAKNLNAKVAMDTASNVMKGYMQLNMKSKSIEWHQIMEECCGICGTPCPIPFSVTEQVYEQMIAGKITVMDLLEKIGED